MKAALQLCASCDRLLALLFSRKFLTGASPQPTPIHRAG